MATERIIIEVTERGAKVVSRNIKSVGREAKTSAVHANILGKALGLIGGALVVRKILRMADAMNQFRNRLVVVSENAGQASRVLDKLFESAQRTRTSFAGNVNLFARLAISAGDLVDSEDELLDVVEDINKAIVISGTNAAEASAGLIQLTQGFAAGVLRGDEFRSVSEQLIGVMEVLQRATGLTRGELRELAFDQKLTGQLIIESFKDQAEFIDAQFAKTIPTVSQSFERLSNAATKTFGDMDKGIGATRLLARSINILADNMEQAIRVATILGATLLSALASKVLIKGLKITIALVRSLTLASATNPFLAMVVGATLLISTLVTFGDKIKLSEDRLATLEDFFVAAFRRSKKAIEEVVIGLGIMFDEFKKGTALEDFELEVETVMRGIVILVDRVATTIFGIPLAIRLAIENPLDILNIKIVQLFEDFVSLARIIPSFILQVAKAFSFIDKLIPGLDLSSFRENIDAALADIDGAFESLNEKIENTFLTGTAKILKEKLEKVLGGGIIIDAFENVLRDAEKVAKERETAQEAADALAGGAARGVKDPELEKRLREFEKFQASLRSVVAAEQELAEAERILELAIIDGNTTVFEAINDRALLARQLEDDLDPLQALKDSFQEEIELLKESSDEREVSITVRELEKALLSSLGQEADTLAESFRGLIIAEQGARKESEARSRVLERTIVKNKEMIATQKAINDEFNKGTFGPQVRDALLAENSALVAFNQNLKEQADLRKLGERDRNVEIKFLQLRQSALIELSKLDALGIALLKERIRRDEEANVVSGIRDQVLRKVVTANEDMIRTQKVINDLFEEGEFGADVRDALLDQTDSVRQLNSEMKQQQELLRIAPRQRAAELKFLELKNNLLEQGRSLGGLELLLIRQKIIANDQAVRSDNLRTQATEQFGRSLREVIELQEALMDLEAMGRISPEQFQLASQDLEPLEKFNLAMDRRVDILRLSSAEQEVQNRTQQEFERLQQASTAGIDVSREAIEKKFRAEQQANVESQIRESLLERFVFAQQDFNAVQKVAKELQDDTTLSVQQYNQAILEAELRLLEFDRTIKGGLRRGLLLLENSFSDLSVQVEGAVVTSFRSAEDALLEFINTGKVGIRELASVIIEEFQRIAIRALILKPLLGLFGGIFGGGSIASTEATLEAGALEPLRSTSKEVNNTQFKVMAKEISSVIRKEAALDSTRLLDQTQFKQALRSMGIAEETKRPKPSAAPPERFFEEGGANRQVAFNQPQPILSPVDTSTSGGSVIFAPIVNVTVNGNGGSQEENQDLAAQISEQTGTEIQRALGEFMRGFVQGEIQNEQRTGGILNRITRV